MKISDLRKSLKNKQGEKWCVYLLECKDGSYYCGITNDIDRRVKQHNNGTGAKYTKGRGPVTLIGFRSVTDRATALKLEALVKKKKKSEKAKFLLEQ
jgi:putative endonuclease